MDGRIAHLEPELAAVADGNDPLLHQKGLSSTLHGERQWPAPLAKAAFHGLAGRVVRAVEPRSEADPAAVLGQFLAVFGNACDRGAGFEVEGDFHGTNLYMIVFGRTSAARKGSSFGHVYRLAKQADPEWAGACVANGLSSGEGLIHAVRDPRVERRRARTNEEKARADSEGYITEETDPGVADKRLFVIEPEFAQVFKVMAREGNTLSPVVRGLWDRGQARTLTKNSAEMTTRAHVSLTGHVTERELREGLAKTESLNGFANRFLFVASKRSKRLPFGGSLDAGELAVLGEELRGALEFARRGPLGLDADARAAWEDAYPALSDHPDDVLGTVTSRAEAQVRRLAVIYALLDLSGVVRTEHLRAALAVWDYCHASAAYLFADILGNPLAERLLSALREAGQLTRTEIRKIAGGREPEENISAALGALRARGLADDFHEPTAGRPVERWRAVERGEKGGLVEESPPAGPLLHENPLSSTSHEGARCRCERPVVGPDLDDGGVVRCLLCGNAPRGAA